MKRALVCGAGGFIGHHLVKYLKNKGYWVRGVDIKEPEYEETAADEFMILDLRMRKPRPDQGQSPVIIRSAMLCAV